MRIGFTKMHGLGNDFIIFEVADERALPSAAQFRALGDRHTGIGFDQALVLMPPRRADTLAYYRIFNSDGSEVEQCGNGVRCIADLLRRQGRAGSTDIRLDSPAGLITAAAAPGGRMAVNMGVPDFDPAALPLTLPAADQYSLEVAGEHVEFGAVSMGNPHAVLTVANVASAPVATLGAALERHPAFPKRVNVGFMQIVDDTHIRLRVFERGVGETQACGTGTCAAVAVGRKAGRLAAHVTVQLPGGELEVRWAGPGEPLWLEGPAVVAFEGQVDLAEFAHPEVAPRS